MYSLPQSVRMKGSAGEPIPHPWKTLSSIDTEFRRGDLSVVASGAGTGKSLLALNLAIRSNVPTLYWSADSAASTQITRATAILTGGNVKEIKRRLQADDFGAYDAALGERWWIRFNYDARPAPGEMERHLKTYFELYNIFPHLIIADNLSNLDSGESARTADGYTFGLEGMCDYLAEMARETQAHVMAMHHVVGEYADGLKPIPQSGLKGKISRVPSLILTMHKEIDGMNGRLLHVSPVKNREGFEDSSGETYATLAFNTANMRIADAEG
jgi:hypothetical protein